MLKRCPTCRKDLLVEDFSPSHRKINGKQCRACHTVRMRKKSLKQNYGLTAEDVIDIVKRQHSRCLGCQQILPTNYVVDHNHSTGVVRGVLCRPCNLVLGLVKEDKSRLTRLRLYLDRDPKKQCVYVIGSLRNPNITKVSTEIRKLGFDVWDEWVAAGPEADDYWQKYETERGHTYKEALNGKAAQNVFYFDRALIDLADIGVLVMPAGKSGHMEIGYMSAQGKPSYILQNEQPDRFDVMPQLATKVLTSLDDLIKELDNVK